MTSAEFRTMTESLGLTAEAAGLLLKVQGRTIRRWQSGEWDVPEDAAEALRTLDARLERAVSEAMQQVDIATKTMSAAPNKVVLVRYRNDEDLHRYRPDMADLPLATHAALLDRLRLALSRRGIAVYMSYLHPEQYEAWRKSRTLPDNEATRASWAAEQV